MNTANYVKAMNNPANQLLARRVDGAWSARNSAGEVVDALRARGASEDAIADAMAEYNRCRAVEDAASIALEQAAH